MKNNTHRKIDKKRKRDRFKDLITSPTIILGIFFCFCSCYTYACNFFIRTKNKLRNQYYF